MTQIFTIGHSNHPLVGFVELLSQHHVTRLVDVRSRPYSRWAPHFEKRALERSLTDASVGYLFLGKELGGRPQDPTFYDADGGLDCARRAQAPDFKAAIEQLIALAGESVTTIMCAEEDPGHCHRRLLITPALRQQDVVVLHIRGDGSLEAGGEPSGAQLSLFD